MSEMYTRSALDYPTPKRLIKHFLKTAITSSEKIVWRNLLNSEAYNKFKDGKRVFHKKKHADEPKPKLKNKK